MTHDPLAPITSMQPAATPVAADRGGLWRWLDERFDLAAIERFARHKEVPVGEHSLFWYFLGGLTLFFFIVQIVTGILLLMYYQAGESTSYESMRYIVTKVPFGWLVRSIHCWSAHLMILSLMLHMWSVLLPARLPQAARADLVHRHRAVRPRARLRLLGLPAALERARLLRDRGRHRLGQGGARSSASGCCG